MSFFSSKWWVHGLDKPWEQWARLEDGGKVSFFDNDGRMILKANYRNRIRASQSLRRRGFRNLSRREAKALRPPERLSGHSLNFSAVQSR